MKKFEKPKLVITAFESENIVTSSGGTQATTEVEARINNALLENHVTLSAEMLRFTW